VENIPAALIGKNKKIRDAKWYLLSKGIA